MNIIGWLLNIPDYARVDRIEGLLLASPMMQSRSSFFWLLLALLLLSSAAVGAYFLSPTRASSGLRIVMASLRVLVLALLLATLCDPSIQITRSVVHDPVVLFVFDDTKSMTVADELDPRLLSRLLKGDDNRSPRDEVRPFSRIDWVRSFLRDSNGEGLMSALSGKGAAEFNFFRFGDDGLIRIKADQNGESVESDKSDREHAAGQLSATGRRTDLGFTFGELAALSRSERVAGVVLVSDFAHNTGDSPTRSRAGGQSAAERLGAPVYTIGVGAVQSRGIMIELQADPRWKRGEKTFVVAKIKQEGFDGQTVRVTIRAEENQSESSNSIPATFTVGGRDITLEGPDNYLELPYTPQVAGQFKVIAEASRPSSGVGAPDISRSERQVTIVDDYLRLLFLADQPSWEWRFVKEVFHRDPLIGMDGFRTFLNTSDPRVREMNPLFLSSFVPSRREFFSADVVFLAETPAHQLDERFLDTLREYVGVFGGGLVVFGGPRHGVASLKPLSDLLPVVLDDRPPVVDVKEFEPQLSPAAAQYPFMRVDDDDEKNRSAWKEMSRISWRQPVAGLHERADALLVHPDEKCRDGKTPQPLISIRRYGAGEVVFLASDETWRLRRIHGEKHYRRFWSQLIYRLAMSHPLGESKRFVLRLGSRRYRSEEQVEIVVDAYDQDYRPLSSDAWPSLAVNITRSEENDSPKALTATRVRDGRYEARAPISTPGEYVVNVTDPITETVHAARFEVVDSSVEMQRTARDEQLQAEIARQTGGRSHDWLTADEIANEIDLQPIKETQTSLQHLWATPLWFMLLVGLLLGEWTLRKLSHMK